MTLAPTARIYIRVSTGQQVSDGYSMDAQREKAIAWCTYQGLSTTQIYPDAGISGSRNDRPALAQLLADLQAGDTVVVYALSRLGRGGAMQMLGIINQIREAKARLVSLTEHIDTETSAGRLMLTVLAALAELEVEQTRERSESGRIEAARQGIYPLGTHSLPLGWMRGADGRVVADEHAPTVRLVMEQGKVPYERTAKMLTARGVPTVRGGKWDVASVRNIVREEAYASGMLRYRSKSRPDAPEDWVSVPVPPLVTREVWEAAQRSGRANHAHKRPDKFPLTGHLLCSCGSAVMGHTGGEGIPNSYICYDRVRKTPTCASNGKRTRGWYTAERIATQARQVLGAYLAQPLDPARLRGLDTGSPLPDEHAQEKARINQQLEALVTLHLHGEINYDHYVAHRAGLLARLNALTPTVAEPAAEPLRDLSRWVPAVLSGDNEELARLLDLLGVTFGLLEGGGLQVLRLVPVGGESAL